jgi:hypothetical protein
MREGPGEDEKKRSENYPWFPSCVWGPTTPKLRFVNGRWRHQLNPRTSDAELRPGAPGFPRRTLRARRNTRACLTRSRRRGPPLPRLLPMLPCNARPFVVAEGEDLHCLACGNGLNEKLPRKKNGARETSRPGIKLVPTSSAILLRNLRRQTVVADSQPGEGHQVDLVRDRMDRPIGHCDLHAARMGRTKNAIPRRFA